MKFYKYDSISDIPSKALVAGNEFKIREGSPDSYIWRQYKVAADGKLYPVRGTTSEEDGRLRQMDQPFIDKVNNDYTKEQLDDKFDDVNLGVTGSIATTMTAPQLAALPDGVYEAQTSGTFANGMVAKENFLTKFKKVGLNWTLLSETKVDVPVGTETINPLGIKLTQEKAVYNFVEGDFKNSITGSKNFNTGEVYTDYPMGTIGSNGVITGTTTDTRRWSGYIYVKGLSKIVFNNFIGDKYIAFYDVNKNPLGVRVDLTEADKEYLVPANAYYFGIVIRIDSIYVQDYANLFYGIVNENGFANYKEVKNVVDNAVLKTNIGELSYTTNILPRGEKYQDYPMGTINTFTGIIVGTTNPERRFSGYLDVTSFTKVTFNGFGVEPIIHYCFYDEDYAPILSTLKVIVEGETVSKPANAKYLAVNIFYGNTPQLNYSQLFVGNINESGFLTEQSLSDTFETIEQLELKYKFPDEKDKIRVDVGKDFPIESGLTQRERIQQALDFVAGDVGGIVYLNADTDGSTTWLIGKSLEIGDNTYLIIGNGVKLKMKDLVFDTIIRNKGIQPNYYGSGVPDYKGQPNTEMAPYFPAIDILPNKNIKILGYGKNNSFIEGADVAYSAVRPYTSGTTPEEWVGDNYGWRTITLCFANVTGLQVEGVGISKTKGWCLVVDYFCKDVLLKNLKILSTVKNGDGIDILQGVEDVVIDNYECQTLDDAIFVGSISRNPLAYPHSLYIFPMYVAQNKLLELWNPAIPNNQQKGLYTKNVSINNVYGGSKTLLLRILSTQGGQVDSISASNIIHTDTSYRPDRVVGVETGYGTGTGAVDSVEGDMTNIKINNVQTVSATKALQVIKIPVTNSWFNKIGKSPTGSSVTFVNTTKQPSLTLTNIS